MERLVRKSKYILPGVILGVVASVFFMSKSTPQDSFEIGSLAYWESMIEIDGSEEAYEHFYTLNHNFSYAQQHENAHVFGEALYKKVGIPGVAVCDAQYGFGCYHSFFGHALISNGLEILPELDQACIDVHGEKGLGCQHGIGHGVLAELGYDNLNEALEACTALNWKGPIGGCTSGVFMEYNFATMLDGQTRISGIDQPHYPCTSVPDAFKTSCYFEQPAWWIAYTTYDYKYAGEKCESIEYRAYKEACYRGVGNVVAGSKDYVIPIVLDACKSMPNAEGEVLCIEGAAWITSAQSELEDRWLELCEEYEGENRVRCEESRNFI